MGALPAILSFVLFSNVISGYVLMNDEENEIIWPSEYHFQGEKINFDTTLKAPFELWYSAEYNRSRIDLYGGVSRRYFDGKEDKVYTIYPKTSSNNMSVEIYCEVYPGFGEEQQDFMPDVSELTFTGQTMTLFDKVVDIWTGTELNGGMTREQTLYVYKTDNGFDIPVQHIIKELNEELGVVDSHVLVNYYNFEDSISEDDLVPAEGDGCDYSDKLGKDFKKDVHVLNPHFPGDVDILFDSYTNHHNKEYHEKEKLMRKRIFDKNWRLIHEHNRKNLGYRLELNAFADKTPEELKFLSGTFASKEVSPLALPFPHTLDEIDELVGELPENFDLRMEGAVTQIKNQGNCGSCWAFATTATLEGAVARASGDRLVDLSEQSVVDCAWSYGNYGCDGGLLDTAWRYVYENGIPTEREYGLYTENNNFCKIKNMTEVYKIKGFTHVTPRNPNALKVALTKYGPVSVGVHASYGMVFYANGIFYDFSCVETGPNHAVTVVGYGNRDGEEFWIVKNSWGESWGEDGYILMSARKDNCYLMDYPYAAIV